MMKMKKQHPSLSFSLFFRILLWIISLKSVTAALVGYDEDSDMVVKRDKRIPITVTDFGTISAVKISDRISAAPYHLHFITLEPNSMMLPVLLHADMVIYVESGIGELSEIEETGEANEISLKKGDVYRLPAGSVFYVQSSLESTREKLRINAIFTNSIFDNPDQLIAGPYSPLSDLVTGFDEKVLQSAFRASEEVIANLTSADSVPLIIHTPLKNETNHLDFKDRIIEALTGSSEVNKKHDKKKKKDKKYNILEKKPDFQNCFGWTTAVTGKDLSSLKGSNIGLFMVNLTQESMLGPHWNPWATEIAIVTKGEGMVRVVCPNLASTDVKCKRSSFRVKQGDLFMVPRYHPMAQMAFLNETFVFMGFSTMARRNHPQFLAGRSSVLRTLDKTILATSFNVPSSLVDQLLSSQAESIILRCQFCAEDEYKSIEERIEKEKQKERERKEEEERKRKEEGEKKRKEEEEAKRREEEEEAARKRKEEEAREKQEEEARKREEEKERQKEKEREAEVRRKEEEAARREAAERQRQEEEEEAAREEEERQEEEEEAAREEEERQKRQEEEEEAAREEERQKRQEERQKRQEEEEEAAREEQQQRERGGGGDEGQGWMSNGRAWRKIFMF